MLARQRLVLGSLDQLQLVLAEAEPAHRAAEVRRRVPIEAEHLAIEALGLVAGPGTGC